MSDRQEGSLQPGSREASTAPLLYPGNGHVNLGGEVSNSQSSTEGSEGLLQKKYSVDDAILHSGFGRYQIALMFACGAVWLTDAIEVMLLTFLMPLLKDEWDLSGGAESLIGALTFAGTMAGAIIWGHVSDRWGRKCGYLWSLVVTATFGAASALSPSIGWLVAARFFVGIGTGGVFVAYSLFAEFVPRTIRGSVLIVEQIFWTIGVTATIGIAAATIPTIGWRWFVFFCALPAWLNLLVYVFVPESPRYLMVKGRQDEAEDILAKVALTNGFEALPRGCITYQQETSNTSIWSLFNSPSLRRVTLVLFFTWFSITLTYYGVTFISPRIFDESNYNIYMGVFITTAGEFPGILVPALLLDRIGRKNMLYIGFLLLAGSSFFLAAPEGTFPNELDTFMLFIARMFGYANFCVIYVFTAELYPTSVRTTGVGACLFFSRLGAITSTFISQDFETSLVMLILGSIAAASILVICLFQHDTSGVDLKEVIDVEEVIESDSSSDDGSLTHKKSLKSPVQEL